MPRHPPQLVPAEGRGDPIGLDKDRYPPVQPARVACWRRVIGPRFFLFVGVIRYCKGRHILLDASRGTTMPVVIVGAGPIEARLRAEARRLGLHHVHFLGHVPEDEKVALLQASCREEHDRVALVAPPARAGATAS